MPLPKQGVQFYYEGIYGHVCHMYDNKHSNICSHKSTSLVGVKMYMRLYHLTLWFTFLIIKKESLMSIIKSIYNFKLIAFRNLSNSFHEVNKRYQFFNLSKKKFKTKNKKFIFMFFSPFIEKKVCI